MPQEIPLVAAVPEWLGEKVAAVGMYLLASGIDVVLGQPLQVSGSPAVQNFLSRQASELVGASIRVVTNPRDAAATILELLQDRQGKSGK